jgi:hypothetical protein
MASLPKCIVYSYFVFYWVANEIYCQSDVLFTQGHNNPHRNLEINPEITMQENENTELVVDNILLTLD